MPQEDSACCINGCRNYYLTAFGQSKRFGMGIDHGLHDKPHVEIQCFKQDDETGRSELSGKVGTLIR